MRLRWLPWQPCAAFGEPLLAARNTHPPDLPLQVGGVGKWKDGGEPGGKSEDGRGPHRGVEAEITIKAFLGRLAG